MFPDEKSLEKVNFFNISEFQALNLVKELDPELYDVAMAVLTCTGLGKGFNSIPLLSDVLGSKNPIQWMTNTSNKTVAGQTASDAYNGLVDKVAVWFVDKMKRLKPSMMFDSRFHIEAVIDQFPDIADPDLLHMSMSVSDYYKDKADFLYGVLKPAFAGFDPFPDNLASGFIISSCEWLALRWILVLLRESKAMS